MSYETTRHATKRHSLVTEVEVKQRIKKFALAAVLAGGMVVGFGGLAFAGGGHRGHGLGGPKMFEKLDGMSEQERLEFLENKLDQRVQKMTQNLDLSKDQQVKVRQIMADAQTQLLEVYEKNKNLDDKSAARGEAHAVLAQSRQDIGDILTDAQKAKLKAQHEARGEQRRGKMLERLDEKLKLTDAQHARVEKILDGAHAKMKALREKGDRKAARGQGRQILEAAGDDINKVLTKEQQVEFAKMREHMRERAGERGKGRKRHGAF